MEGNVVTVTVVGDRTAEMTLPGGCPTCGGDIELRMSPEGAHTYCKTCHVLSHPHLSWRPDGVTLEYRHGARA